MTGYKADAIIVGGGLAGISAAIELLNRDKKVIIFDRDEDGNFGGLARESFGGICMIDTPEQRKMGIKDSPEQALRDWLSFAEFGPDDDWPQKWAEFYTANSIEYIYEWLKAKKLSFLKIVNWPERGLLVPGNSVPRWHITWGTGQGLVLALLDHLRNHPNRQNLTLRFHHKVDTLETTGEVFTGCQGVEENTGKRFQASAGAIIIAAGGYCGNLNFVRKHWHGDMGNPPEKILNGSHKYANGEIHRLVEKAGGNITHLDNQFHYAAGIHHPDPRKENHGLSLIPPKSALWLNAEGKRIGPLPLVTAFDTRYLVSRICQQPHGYSWQVMNRKIMQKEIAVSGSEYMTDFRDKRKFRVIMSLLFGNKRLMNRLLDECVDFVAAHSVEELVEKMNALNGNEKVRLDVLQEEIRRFDEQIDRWPKFANDDQLRRIAHVRQFIGDRLRTCKFQKINDPKAYPLIAVREFILSRKSLGGIQTDLRCRVLSPEGKALKGLYAIGESAGFGGGGIHGIRSLEGTFLGSCIITGRVVGETAEC